MSKCVIRGQTKGKEYRWEIAGNYVEGTDEQIFSLKLRANVEIKPFIAECYKFVQNCKEKKSRS